ncbi:MAG: 16S rRNA (cytidine(1402)-2'-O)-methyltransferase [Gammaproteobacteria bacterium]|jgi:16S rRNA (cytidine1402-2'-O)-methyltransferase
MQGILYIVASPIGCLQDISAHALDILRSVNLIACEDTRHSATLLNYYGIQTPLKAYHSHNENDCSEFLLKKLINGETIALISDAGTPLIHDPGLSIVQQAQKAGVRIVPIPGPCALITALSASGLPAAQFIFDGFLPIKSTARIKHLESLKTQTRTQIFYEAPHRILECLQDMLTVFGKHKQVVLARELTKLHETFLSGTLSELISQLLADPHQQKGEFVILVAGATELDDDAIAQAKNIFATLTKELPHKQAAALTAKITGVAKNTIYQWGLE